MVMYNLDKEKIIGIFEERRNTAMLFSRKEKGQGMVEYALIIVLVAVVLIIVLALVGSQISNVFSRIVSGLAT
jgi:pilus assembly protein Flp/PilA